MFFRLTKSLYLALFFWGALFLCCFAVSAQVPAPTQASPLLLPTLEVSSNSLPPNGNLTLSLPPGATLPSKRVELAIYEWNHAQPVDAIWRIMEVRDGRWQTNVSVSAEPGLYEFRLVTTDKIPRPLTAKAPEPNLIVPGITREAGWWLVNGLPFFYVPKMGEVSPSATPLFLSGLQRDLSPKSSAPNRKNIFNNQAPWRTLPLPALREMLNANYDWAALKSDLAKRLVEAQNRGERGFWGWSLAPGEGAAPLLGAGNAISQLRRVLNEISPGAALICDVDSSQKFVQAARDLEGAAPFCDAILLRVPDNDGAFWAMKTARRLVEEQPAYDLPLLVRVQKNAPPARQTLRAYWMAGATGFVFDETQIDADVRQFQNEIARDAALWIGAVTLEDTGVLPPPDAPDAIDDEALLQFVEQLRAIGRAPLVARASVTSKPESLMLRLGNRISATTIERLEKSARAGATIYLEGVPTFDETGKAAPWRLATLVGAEITAIPPKRSAMVLDDPWVFGTKRGARVPVEQNFAIKLQESSMAAQAKVKKGVLTQVGPRAAATLEDGSPALIINVLGKGEVVWLPHRLAMTEAPVIDTQNGVPVVAAPTASAPGSSPARDSSHDSSTPWQIYLRGVADYVAPRLVQQRAAQNATQNAKALSDKAFVALRRSPKGTLLLWLDRKNNGINNGAAADEIVTEGASTAVLELNDLKNISSTTRGLRTTFRVPNGDALLALAPTQKDLDAERNAPRAIAKLR